ncbi:MAG: hypothetical protein GEU99_21330 [Luteitalea sp.]|nr:hypothetical protein [Luteitalea sp.]
MSTEEAPKSSYELAMERLRKKDADAGVDEQPLTDTQRASIADVRQFYGAKMAELEILHKSALASVWDPSERARLEEEYRRDGQRLQDERDSKIAKIRESG